MILQLRHATFNTQSLKEIHSGRETGLIDTGPFNNFERVKGFQQNVVAVFKTTPQYNYCNFHKFLIQTCGKMAHQCQN